METIGKNQVSRTVSRQQPSSESEFQRELQAELVNDRGPTHRLHSSSFAGFIFYNPRRQSQKGTTMEPMGKSKIRSDRCSFAVGIVGTAARRNDETSAFE